LRRTATWAGPGRPPSCMLGGQIWLQARAEATERAGDAFSLKESRSEALRLGSIGLDPLGEALTRAPDRRVDPVSCRQNSGAGH